jgi:hypothetical protein
MDTKIKLGTRVKTCNGGIGTVRKQYLCEDGSYNYRIVFDKHQPNARPRQTFYTEWITRDSFEVVR